MEKKATDEREDRLVKLKRMREAGINPYPAKTNRNIIIGDILSDFEKLEKEEKRFILAGRIRSRREHGGLTFAQIEDESGRIQIAFFKDELENGDYNLLGDFVDVGDFLEVEGVCFKTKKGEPTIRIRKWKILSKAIRPLPDKWCGLIDLEERLRKRYLDILCNPDVKDMIYKKAKFWDSVRNFLKEKGFLEVETPVLELNTGGADARPFITHHNALDMNLYLRISMGELWQKRLMVAGFEKIFELGRQFRNEGMDAEHLQDYTQMEFYWAYSDDEKGMELVEEMYKYVAMETFGKLKFKIKEFDIDLGKKWERYDFAETIMEKTGIDVLNTNEKEVEKKLVELGIKYDKKGFNLNRAIDNLWKYCRRQIAGPGFLINTPIIISPLAKRNEDNPKISRKFQPIIAGSELGNGYSELNDPVDQRERFEEQQKMRDAGDEEAQMFDEDFIEAIEYGMPPTCGFGMPERFFSFLMDKPMRETQIFPLMKPKK